MIKNQIAVLEIKSTISQIENFFDGLNSKHDIAEEGISQCEQVNRNYPICKIERKRAKK